MYIPKKTSSPASVADEQRYSVEHCSTSGGAKTGQKVIFAKAILPLAEHNPTTRTNFVRRAFFNSTHSNSDPNNINNWKHAS